MHLYRSCTSHQERMPYNRRLDPRYLNSSVDLPYGLTVDEVAEGVSETYRLFDGLNRYLVSQGFKPLEELLLGNSLSGIISELLVKNISRSSKAVEANLKVGGYPDLLPRGHYESNQISKGDEGIEIKCSVQKGGWQGHNPEDCYIIIFRYIIGNQEDAKILPLTFIEILCARLQKADWSFSGRKEGSRRTPTASITITGIEKLRANCIYRIPGVGVGKYGRK